MEPADHYDQRYYAWQQSLGRFGGTAGLIKFQPHIAKSDNVLDFGCGGGFLLANLICADRIGIEVNAIARADCERLNLRVFDNIDDVPDQWADKIISNHALEHTVDPYETILRLKSKLKPGGIAIFVVPCESIGTNYTTRDINKHLYTWSPINLGNLFAAAGYNVVECKPFLHRWVPKPMFVQKLLGWNLFHTTCWAYGYLFRGLSQVRIIAAPMFPTTSRVLPNVHHDSFATQS